MLQPAYEGLMEPQKVLCDFPNARKVTTDTFFLGTSPVITEEHLDYIEKTVYDFFNDNRISLNIRNHLS